MALIIIGLDGMFRTTHSSNKFFIHTVYILSSGICISFLQNERAAGSTVPGQKLSDTLYSVS